MSPISTGKNAPPATAITTNDEPISVSSLMSSMANEKIVGNMMDSKNGTANNAHTAISDFTNVATANNATQINEYMVSNRLAAIYRVRNVPAKRPTIKPNMAMPNQNAASFSGVSLVYFAKRIKKLVTQTCAPT